MADLQSQLKHCWYPIHNQYYHTCWVLYWQLLRLRIAYCYELVCIEPHEGDWPNAVFWRRSNTAPWFTTLSWQPVASAAALKCYNIRLNARGFEENKNMLETRNHSLRSCLHFCACRCADITAILLLIAWYIHYTKRYAHELRIIWNDCPSNSIGPFRCWWIDWTYHLAPNPFPQLSHELDR